MPDENTLDEAVLTRLRSVLPEAPASAVPLPQVPARGAAVPVSAARVPGGRGRAVGAGWADRFESADRPGHAAGFRDARADVAGLGEPDGAGFGEPGEPTAGRLTGVGAFDPGRRGVRVLAAVAVVVVLAAAFLAWRARPRVEPVPTSDAGVVAGDVAAPGAPVSDSGPGGDPPVPPAPSARVGAPAAGAGQAAPAGAPAAGPAAEVVVAVGGKVSRPGLVRLSPGARVADALQAAGGAHRGVDVALLNLARKVVDGELILVGVTPPPDSPLATAAGAPTSGASPGAGPVNLNTATVADLDTLPGVGPVLAQRIIDHREQHGTFTAVSDLRKIEGIGSARYDQLKDLVTV